MTWRYPYTRAWEHVIRLSVSKASGRWSIYLDDFLVCEASDRAEGEKFFAIVRQTLISLGCEVKSLGEGEDG